jgi:hypothetical protein
MSVLAVVTDTVKGSNRCEEFGHVILAVSDVERHCFKIKQKRSSKNIGSLFMYVLLGCLYCMGESFQGFV